MDPVTQFCWSSPPSLKGPHYKALRKKRLLSGQDEVISPVQDSVLSSTSNQGRPEFWKERPSLAPSGFHLEKKNSGLLIQAHGQGVALEGVESGLLVHKLLPSLGHGARAWESLACCRGRWGGLLHPSLGPYSLL